MPSRFLTRVVIIVWAIAALVALLVGLPTLVIVEGVHIDAGLIINALTALGAFSAALAAVWVATSDRRDRKHERDVEDEAQAKLVIVYGRCQENQSPELQVMVSNSGTRGIVDVTFVRIAVDGHDDLDDLQPTSGPIPPIVAPASFAPGNISLITFDPNAYGPAHPYYIAIRGGPSNQPRTITINTTVTATIRWTDGRGKTWERWGRQVSGPPPSGVRIDLGTPVRIS
jgi:hypothetical protein